MKPINRIMKSLAIVALGWAALSLTACKEAEDTTWVDLRYRVEDAYTVAADGSQTVTFQVKSTLPWRVEGTETGDWYTISPASGEAGETYDVTITCKVNNDLDDREDTISIRSDYWTGKQFVLTQKGIAYLTADENTDLAKMADRQKINVRANQKWSAAVTDGDPWLSIVAGQTGELDGAIEVASVDNLGERRIGVVTIYDRHDVPVFYAQCTQNGVILTPADPADPAGVSFYRCYHESRTLEIAVEANEAYTAEKSNPDEETWFTFRSEGGDFTPDGELHYGNLTVELAENDTPALREGKIVLRTIAQEGVEPLVKTVTIKQAPNAVANPTVVAENITGNNGNNPGGSGSKAGRYDFHLAGDAAKGNVRIYWVFPSYLNNSNAQSELRYWLQNNAGTQGVFLSSTNWDANLKQNDNPYTSYVDGTTFTLDKTKDNVLSMQIREEQRDLGDKGSSWCKIYWYFNGKLIVTLNTADRAAAADGFRMPFSALSSGKFAFYDGFKLNKIEYFPVIDWGEYVAPEFREEAGEY